MPRRILTPSLALAALLAAFFAQLVWNGRHAKKVVAGNIAHPPLSSGTREIDLWHPTASFGHVYDLTFTWPEEKPWSVPEGSRLELQLSSGGRTRLLVVRNGHPNDSVSWWDVLSGRERLQVVADRGWIDLGPIPSSGAQLEVQVLGLLPAPFGFAEPHKPGTAHFSGFHIRRPDSPRARPSRSIVRYRFRAADPISAGESLTRLFFFVSCSGVLQVAGLGALVLLFTGWWWLWDGRIARAVAALVPAVTLFHACGLAPLQGADEATHVGTVEATLFNPGLFETPGAYPQSIVTLYQQIGYESWVEAPEIPVTGLLPENRAATRTALAKPLVAEAVTNGGARVDATLINPRTRAPFYYNGFRLAGPLLRKLSVLDRVEAYVILSALASLALFLAGLVVLARGGLESLVLPYAIVALWPYAVGVVASCSNYSLAIGIGQFLAACLVTGVLTSAPRHRLAAAALFLGASLFGIGVWDDFVFFAVPAALVLTGLAAHAALRMPSGTARRRVTGAMLAAAASLTATFMFALATGRVRHAISSFGARLPRKLGGFEDPSLWLLLAAAVAPLLVSLILVLAIVRGRELAEGRQRRWALARSAALTVLFAAMFVATRWTPVPFEATRLDYPDEVAAHWSAFWSNNFAFDQDMLSWKMYWGVFGYADVSYPDALYAFARWGCVALFLALPLLSWRFTRRSPGRSSLLLVAAGYALTACIVTNSLRYFQPTNPWGRFIMPALPLAALPLLVRAAAPERDRGLRLAAAALVVLHVWTAVVLLGSRYAVGL